MGLLLVLLTAASIVGIAFYQKDILKNNIRTEVVNLIESETKKVAQDVYLMCRIMQESLEQRLGHGLKVAERVLERTGPLSFSSETRTWTAVNQYTGQQKEFILPKMLLGGKWLKNNIDFAVPVPVVDEVSSLLGMTCTLFQRANEAGDMVRVATSVPDSDGSRAIGTYIPRFNPDGAPNQVIEHLLEGKVFTGRAYVVNDWYLTSYLPLYDTAGKRVVGALYVGQKQESVTSLRRGIMDIRVGKTGYVAVVGGKGEQQGRYIISKKGQRDHENLLKTVDSSTRPVIIRIISEALNLTKSNPDDAIPVNFYRYQWQNPGESEWRPKLAAVTYFEPWDWIIMATAYKDDFQEAQQRMGSALSHMIHWITWVALIIILLALTVSFYIAKGISQPLESAVAVFDEIGRGQLDMKLNLTAKDEIGQLSKAFNAMIGNLKQVTASRDELNQEVLQRAQVESELREISARREELETIVNHSPTVVLLWQATPGWPVKYVSENIEQFGFSTTEFYSGELLFISIIHPDDLSRVVAEFSRRKETRSNEDFILEYRLVNAKDEVCWVETRAWTRHDSEGAVTHFQGVLLNITARKKAEEAVHKLAYYDSLTQLPNRTLLLDRLDQVLAQTQRDERNAALLFLDLDSFKAVNDRLGHIYGDSLLKAVGQRLDSCIRKNDTLARFGGDEFIVLLPGVRQVPEVKVVAEKILATMNQPFSLEGEQIMVTTSIGIVLFPDDGEDVTTLLKRADIAMYAAKSRGRNSYYFFDKNLEEKKTREV